MEICLTSSILRTYRKSLMAGNQLRENIFLETVDDCMGWENTFTFLLSNSCK